MAEVCENCGAEAGILDSGGRVVVQEFSRGEYENSSRDFPSFASGDWVALCVTNDGSPETTCEKRYGPK